MDDAGRTADAGDAPPGPRSGRRAGRPARPVAAMLTAALLVLASTATWYIERRSDSLEHQRRQDERALFERAYNDPISAAAMVINTPAFASRCPVRLRHLLSIPADEVRPGPALVDAYLDRLFVLLGAQVPGGMSGRTSARCTATRTTPLPSARRTGPSGPAGRCCRPARPRPPRMSPGHRRASGTTRSTSRCARNARRSV
ncbi:hypothetical protein [Micromonospora pallida]|nr:hypothetical protein [Micromonospora pallida]